MFLTKLGRNLLGSKLINPISQIRNIITVSQCKTKIKGLSRNPPKVNRKGLKLYPLPTKTVPDVETFLKKIGRNTDQFASNFESWKQFWLAPISKFEQVGMTTKQKRYVVSWRDKFIKGFEPRLIKPGQKVDGGFYRRAEFLHKGRIAEIKQRRLDRAKQQKERLAQKAAEKK